MIFLFYFWVHFHVHVYLFKQLLVVVEYDKKCFNFNPPPLSLTHTHKIIMQKSSYPLLRKCGLYGERHRMFGSSLWRSKQNHLSFSFAHVFAKISFKNQKKQDQCCTESSSLWVIPCSSLHHKPQHTTSWDFLAEYFNTNIINSVSYRSDPCGI